MKTAIANELAKDRHQERMNNRRERQRELRTPEAVLPPIRTWHLMTELNRLAMGKPSAIETRLIAGMAVDSLRARGVEFQKPRAKPAR